MRVVLSENSYDGTELIHRVLEYPLIQVRCIIQVRDILHCISPSRYFTLYISFEIFYIPIEYERRMSRGFASKSMFRSTMVGYETKSMINPVSGLGGGGAGNTISITEFELQSILSIQRLYTRPLAAKQYENIPVDFTQYLKLREAARIATIKYQNIPALSILFQITVDGITGAVNAYGLNTLNTETQVQNLYLQGVINEIVGGVNVQTAFNDTEGTLSMKQTLQLAPLFRYYISIYGLPDPGVGFDPAKLATVLTALENSGIDPYN